jgi:hypothetical protein
MNGNLRTQQLRVKRGILQCKSAIISTVAQPKPLS